MKVFGDIGQIPTDWFGAPPKNVGRVCAGCDKFPFLGQTVKRHFTDVITSHEPMRK